MSRASMIRRKRTFTNANRMKIQKMTTNAVDKWINRHSHPPPPREYMLEDNYRITWHHTTHDNWWSPWSSTDSPAKSPMVHDTVDANIHLGLYGAVPCILMGTGISTIDETKQRRRLECLMDFVLIWERVHQRLPECLIMNMASMTPAEQPSMPTVSSIQPTPAAAPITRHRRAQVPPVTRHCELIRTTESSIHGPFDIHIQHQYTRTTQTLWWCDSCHVHAKSFQSNA